MPTLSELRATVSEKRDTIAFLVDALAQAEASLESIRRTTGDPVSESATEGAIAITKGQIAQAYADYKNAIDALQVEIGNAVPSSLTWQQEADRLNGYKPVVLYPVRIQTRFDEAAGDLLVRIYPDDILVNTHQPGITRAEEQAAKDYYTKIHASGGNVDVQISAWKNLVVLLGNARAVYAARVVTPDFGAGFQNGVFTDHANTPATAPIIFPTVAHRSDSWTGPATAILPDRWNVALYRNGEKVIATTSGPVREPLHVTIDPSAPQTRLGTSATINGVNVATDSETLWLTDFEAAISVGMALRIHLGAFEIQQGYDRVVVLGLKTSMDLDETNKMLGDLFDGHRFSRGFTVLPPDIATNGTEGAPAGDPYPDPTTEAAYHGERGFFPPPRVRDDDSNVFAAGQLARALGVGQSVTYQVGNSSYRPDANAGMMNAVLWPACLGYFAHVMMDPLFRSPDGFEDIEKVRRYFTRWVRARGYAPPFVVGKVAYGALPATRFSRWQSNVNEDDPGDKRAEQVMLPMLQMMKSHWLWRSESVARIHADDGYALANGTPARDLNEDLATTLAVEGRGRQTWVRSGSAKEIVDNILGFFGQLAATVNSVLGFSSGILGQGLGAQIDSNLVAGTRITQVAFSGVGLLETPLVIDPNAAPPSEYIAKFGDANVTTLEALRTNTIAGLDPVPDALLYKLLRHSLLVEYAIRAQRLLVRFQPNYNPATMERVVWGIYQDPPTEETIWSIFQKEYPFLNGGQTMEEYLTVGPSEDSQRIDDLRNLFVQGESFSGLENVEPAELERCLMEMLDLCSHRLDAWISAFPARRLDNQTSNSSPRAAFGCYGVVEDLRVRPRTTEVMSDARVVETDRINGGFVHAPSMDHASAAAILRNGFLTQRRDHPERYAVDLDSRRVRDATEIVEEVRNGQQLGAILGYRLERYLHDAGANTLIAPLRNLFPLVAGKFEEPHEDPVAVRAARSVVDGLRLLRALDAGTVLFGQGGLPPVGQPDYITLMAGIESIRRRADGVSDLLMAESVFQVARGNIPRGSATLDAVVRGVLPPEPEFTKIPRSATAVTHRVAIAFADSPVNYPPGWNTSNTLRWIAEPGFDNWLARLLGDANTITCAVKVGGNEVDRISVVDLDLGALQFLGLAHTLFDNPAGASDIVDGYVLDAADIGTANPEDVEIDYGDAPTPGRSFAQAFEVLRVALGLFHGGRRLKAVDLLAPEDVPNGVDLDAQTASVHAQHTNGVITAFGNAINAANNALVSWQAGAMASATARQDLVEKIRALTLAMATNVVPASLSNADLNTAAIAVLTEADARRQRALSEFDGADPFVTGEQALFTIFGRGHAIFPRFVVPNRAAVVASIGKRDTVLGGDVRAPDRFVQSIARTRDAMVKSLRLSIYSRAFGSSFYQPHVVQMPPRAGDKWIALEGAAIQPGTLSFVCFGDPVELSAATNWSGVLVDEWVETVPDAEIDTGVSFHFESEAAEAPNLILTAVNPSHDGTWQHEDLLGTILETLDLAKVRAVHPDLLGSFSQYLPTVMLAQNDDDKVTVSSLIRRSRGTPVSST
jgi:hypothetical protein